MKLLFSFLLAAPVFALSQNSLPNRFEVLTESYERAVERVTKPITQKYILELKTLQRELTQKGDLAQAQQIENMLRQLGVLEKTLLDVLLSQKWEYSTGKSKSQIVFKDDGSAELSGASTGVMPWKIEDELTLSIIYSDGNSCTFKFKSLKDLLVEGTTKLGNQKRTLKPIE